MEISKLSTDRLHEFAVYLAAAEAARRTRHPIKIGEEERRFRLEINGKLARVFSRRTAQERPMRLGTKQGRRGCARAGVRGPVLRRARVLRDAAGG